MNIADCARRTRAVGLVALLTGAGVGATVAESARADETSDRAEALFQRGRALMGQKDYAAACPLIEQAYSLDHGAGTLLAMALCHEGSGKLATALREYRESLTLAVQANRSDRVMLAESHVQQLEASVPRVKILPPSPEPNGLVITLDGAPADPSAMTAGVPVDPGRHAVAATAPASAPWQTHVDVVAGAEPVVVQVPPMASVASPDAAPPSQPGSASRALGWASVAATVVAAGIGSFFGVEAFNKEKSSKPLCPGNVCTTQTGFDDNRLAHQDALVSDVAFGVAGAALVAGLWLLLRHSSSGAGPTASRGIGFSASW
jgi:hypothetical protein